MGCWDSMLWRCCKCCKVCCEERTEQWLPNLESGTCIDLCEFAAEPGCSTWRNWEGPNWRWEGEEGPNCGRDRNVEWLEGRESTGGKRACDDKAGRREMSTGAGMRGAWYNFLPSTCLGESQGSKFSCLSLISSWGRFMQLTIKHTKLRTRETKTRPTPTLCR